MYGPAMTKGLVEGGAHPQVGAVSVSVAWPLCEYAHARGMQEGTKEAVTPAVPLALYSHSVAALLWSYHSTHAPSHPS